MFRRLLILLLVLCLALSVSASAAAMEEEDVDITELVKIEEEETVRDKKDSDGAYIMTVTCTGDFTIGGDNYHKKDLFTPELKNHDGDINFIMAGDGVRDLFINDDLTILNFEGTLTDTKSVPDSKKNNDFLFNISPDYVSVLPDNGVEAVSLANNHVFDHGEAGLADTKIALDSAGVLYASSTEPFVWNYKNQIQVAVLAYNCLDRYGDSFHRHHETGEFTDEFLSYDTFEEAVCADISAAKELYPLVIVCFHWGKEKMYSPTDNQVRLGRMAVDAGADLIIGNHSHRIQPIECYNGKYICYSLGNFCFAGHNKPSDMSSFIFQIRYRIKGETVSLKDFRVIPIRISSTKDRNDFIPTVFPDGSARDAVLNTLKDPSNIKGLDYAVTEFPLEFR